MPNGTWFDALTLAGTNAWEDGVIITGLSTSITALALSVDDDIATFTVFYNGVRRVGVPVAVTAPGVVSLDSAQSGVLGTVRVAPIAFGATEIVIGPYLGSPAVSIQVNVSDPAIPQLTLRLVPATFDLDLTTGGVWVTAMVGNDTVADLPVSYTGPGIQVIEDATDEDGRFRVEPMQVGVGTVTVDDITVNVNVTRSIVDSAYPRTIRMDGELPVIRIGDPPFSHRIVNHNMAPVGMAVRCDASGGYLKVARDSLSGTFHYVPRSVGEGRLVFTAFDRIRRTKLELHRRYEVLP